MLIVEFLHARFLVIDNAQGSHVIHDLATLVNKKQVIAAVVASIAEHKLQMETRLRPRLSFKARNGFGLFYFLFYFGFQRLFFVVFV
jgi:hypothetical protein